MSGLDKEDTRAIVKLLQIASLISWGIAVGYMTKYWYKAEYVAITVVILLIIILVSAIQNVELEELKEKEEWQEK